MQFLRHPLALLLITLLAGLFSLSLHFSVRKTQISSEQVQLLDQEMNQMASEVSALEDEVKQAGTPEMQEKIIRNELLMQKNGEYVVQLPSTGSGNANLPPQASLSPWQQWWQMLTSPY